MIFQIKVYMTAALLLYFLAYFLAKKMPRGHIVIAFLGFGLDLYATYAMEMYREASGLMFSHYTLTVKLHTIVAVIALLLFLVQAIFGFMGNKKAHVFFAKYFFLPVWTVAFLSGLYLIF